MPIPKTLSAAKSARIEIPSPPGKTYQPFQEKGIRYAAQGNTLLADEMGLGKTVQAIGVINVTKPKTVLIVCPATLVGNWHVELDAWLVYSGEDQKIDVVTYHRADSLANESSETWDLLIIDEAHYCKNPTSERSQNCVILASRSKHILALTGTPIDKSPIDLWPLLKMLAPKTWDPEHTRIGVIVQEQRATHPGEGPNFWAYAKEYCGLKRVTFRQGYRMRTAWDFGGATNLDKLQKKLRSTIMVRRLKKDVLTELPDKRRQLIVLPAVGNDDDMYHRIARVAGELSETNYFAFVHELRSDKVLFEEWSQRRHEQALEKLDHCLRFIGDALDSSHKLIVFAHHRDVILKLIRCIDSEFENPDEYSVALFGGMTQAQKQQSVESFQNDPKCRVFVGSLGAAGVGITLTAASHEIFVELDPMPSRMNQAEDRAHRIGQKEMVLVQHLVRDGSLCARMAKILVKKQGVISRALDGLETESFFGYEGDA